LFSPITLWKQPWTTVAPGSYLATPQWDIHQVKQVHKGRKHFDTLFTDALWLWKGSFKHNFDQQQDRNYQEPPQPQF
jgi:hypothetical protein